MVREKKNYSFFFLSFFFNSMSSSNPGCHRAINLPDKGIFLNIKFRKKNKKKKNFG